MATERTVKDMGDEEQRMTDAHSLGRVHANEEFAHRVRIAMDTFPGKQIEQEVYLVGFIAELRRHLRARM